MGVAFGVSSAALESNFEFGASNLSAGALAGMPPRFGGGSFLPPGTRGRAGASGRAIGLDFNVEIGFIGATLLGPSFPFAARVFGTILDIVGIIGFLPFGTRAPPGLGRLFGIPGILGISARLRFAPELDDFDGPPPKPPTPGIANFPFKPLPANGLIPGGFFAGAGAGFTLASPLLASASSAPSSFSSSFCGTDDASWTAAFKAREMDSAMGGG
mmetsp:Transcript_11104/g.27286  ORF Transcript_11104/g.27286 Transcript_11104/m.27286 type:complete len:215 (+) Transcript_11104:1023-1667(+)